MKISEMCRRAHDNALSKGWYESDIAVERPFGAEVALFHSELSEALEAYRERGYESWLSREGTKPEGVMSELADVLIRIADTSERLKRDGLVTETLEEAVVAKMAYNATRPHRHGGKRL